MEFGTFHLMPVAPWTTEEETIQRETNAMRLADELGFDAVWLAEHQGSDYGMIGNAAVILAAVAASTKRIRLGTAVSVLPLHHPLRTAEEYAFVDQISGGRLELGVGRGYQPGEFTRYGLNVSENRVRFEESLEILKGAWTSEGEFEYDGMFYQIPPTTVHPKPLQKPHPPLWIATGSIETMEWAGRQLIPFMAAPLLPHAVLNGRREAFIRAATDAGHTAEDAQSTASDFWLLKSVFVADSDQEARDACERSFSWYFAELNARRMFEAPAEPQPYEFYLNPQSFFWGTPKRVRDTMQQAIAETGAKRIMCWFDHGGMDADALTHSLQLFADKVMPHFK